MKTTNVKYLGEKHIVKLFKKFQVSKFNLAIVDFPYRNWSSKTVVEFSTGMQIGTLGRKLTFEDYVKAKHSINY